MKHILKSALASVVIFAGTGAAIAQDGPHAEVIHWWTSGGESAAVKTFAESFSKAGGVWVDAAIAGGDNARAAAVNRMIGGNPPAAVQFNIGKQFDDLVDQGLLRNLDDIAAANKWKETLPKPVLDSITRNGHIYAAPIDIHGQNWMWYSKPAFEKAGITNPPASFDELFADLDKLKAAGIVPLALNGQARHMALIFNSLLLTEGGHDLYLKVYRDHDADAVNSPEFKKIVERFGKFRAYTDAGFTSRLWNDATSMLIKNTAGVQFMGDWAKGEFTVAQKKQGTDYGCIVGPGTHNYIIGGDVFIFPKSADAKQTEAQDLLAKTLLTPEALIAFNLKKGGIPTRTDVDMSSFDQCAQDAASYIKDPANQLPDYGLVMPPDVVGSIQDLVSEYFTDPDFSVDEFVARFADAIQTAG